ncbi:hypothetical protein RRG08_021485 [Elysia crispata]|uniref:Uncharacterized protein n=1 Tax=Elysia crispata TaxID=231223 RepID=A0AAE1BBT7_9GAST|nr:hypothetical protein RRG08_021485 [Elysia crispata]
MSFKRNPARRLAPWHAHLGHTVHGQCFFACLFCTLSTPVCTRLSFVCPTSPKQDTVYVVLTPSLATCSAHARSAAEGMRRNRSKFSRDQPILGAGMTLKMENFTWPQY